MSSSTSSDGSRLKIGPSFFRFSSFSISRYMIPAPNATAKTALPKNRRITWTGGQHLDLPREHGGGDAEGERQRRDERAEHAEVVRQLEGEEDAHDREGGEGERLEEARHRGVPGDEVARGEP